MGPISQSDTGDSTLMCERAQIDALVDRIRSALERHAWPGPSKFAVRLALEEALSNAFRHGHRNLPRDTPVHVRYDIGPDELTITVADRGPGFDPGAVPDPTLDENLERPSGRGLMLMRAYMTQINFNAAGNEVTMLYRRPTRK